MRGVELTMGNGATHTSTDGTVKKVKYQLKFKTKSNFVVGFPVIENLSSKTFQTNFAYIYDDETVDIQEFRRQKIPGNREEEDVIVVQAQLDPSLSEQLAQEIGEFNYYRVPRK